MHAPVHDSTFPHVLRGQMLRACAHSVRFAAAFPRPRQRPGSNVVRRLLASCELGETAGTRPLGLRCVLAAAVFQAKGAAPRRGTSVAPCEALFRALPVRAIRLNSGFTEEKLYSTLRY